jgi:hypothetical protein
MLNWEATAAIVEAISDLSPAPSPTR